MESTQKSPSAVIITVIYILFVIGAFLVMFLANEDESFEGIFVVLVAMPWSMLLSWFTNRFGVESITFNTVFSMFSCLINVWVIYSAITFGSKLFRRR